MFKKASRDVSASTDSVKALLVGINYTGTPNQLGGCIKDAQLTRQNILAEYPNAVIETMTDDTSIKPTRANILSKLTALISSAKVGDTLMFHYSGHGGQVPDLNGDEEDGYDETICPIDFMNARVIKVNGADVIVDSQIIDDEIHEIISKVPRGVKFFMLSDSCFSGTIGDLKHDLAHCHGGGEVEDDSEVDGQGVHFGAANTQQQPTPVSPPVTTNTSWIYINSANVVWITPLNPFLYQELGNRHLTIRLNNIPSVLNQNPNRSIFCDTTFTKVDGNTYKIDAPQLGINQLLINVNINKDAQFNLFCNSAYEYDSKACKHRHYTKNSVRSISMKAPCTIGGELRIISGCEENQTSADTGTNGACTKAFWDAVRCMGGLRQFFPNLFSHHIEDLKFIQDSVNYNLSRFGFTQHSVISWEHAHGRSSSSSSQYVPAYQGFSRNRYDAYYRTMVNCYPVYDPLPLHRALEQYEPYCKP